MRFCGDKKVQNESCLAYGMWIGWCYVVLVFNGGVSMDPLLFFLNDVI